MYDEGDEDFLELSNNMTELNYYASEKYAIRHQSRGYFQKAAGFSSELHRLKVTKPEKFHLVTFTAALNELVANLKELKRIIYPFKRDHREEIKNYNKIPSEKIFFDRIFE